MASRFCLRFRSRLQSTLSQFSAHRASPFIAVPESLLSITSPSNLSVIPVEFSFSSAGIRYLSTLNRQPVRKRTVDIGARARQLQNRRLWTYALTFSCIAGFIVIVLNNFQDQLVFYVTPTDAMEKYSTNPSKNKFRLGGLVLEGSVTQPASSPDMEFVVTDLITDILVRYQGSLPDLFREGHSVVVEGFVRPFSGEPKEKLASSARRVSAKALSGDCYFAATEVLAKHDEKYMPQEVAAAIEKNKAKIEAEAVAESGQGRARVA
ncbi:cytochrome c-type biogenesis protein CcmE homolog, mitochondrial-like [Macadamia integrifolia]|uniref:cytochrome c-type biogenesis protein CcmE homolog, mitochondrial-like n=1 Tax=Macadamia integrifolia TaxID=60698 RepID=UPI001C4F82F7|nr:cytochrome c-type biogenesis protein CcmE homolog, mitochondrial-like [Macadamia integrifolia]XP_042485341.1 cytochrome c-type biogenesis protein CcmE homolog, mitochondrial-like [Macadamia integrifolia]XP_042485928.1 cytochrome c-type biogenesis protein CcmE homolog, mitochondrial-like [Macadamia integrifolia]XP_042486328.1 cytochrome c-type biogenesis protein CcmE homolog, mitochondrial-like [Macadamia integrifolia]XP_042505103.1 cytochrome c-type biogenesis protein CcmE homolog, mitochond